MIETAPYDRENTVSNYRKLFTRGSSLTKEILERVQRVEVANRKKYICGYEFKTRHIWMLAGLIILFFCSLAGTITFWFTNTFDEIVKAHLVLKNGSDSFNSWSKPSASAYLKIHIFNYTNVEDYTARRSNKLIVKDVGPYTYEETVERVNTVFNEDGTLTYQETKGFQFVPDLSNRQSDRVTVPNMPMISAITLAKDTFYMTRIALNSLLQGLDAEPFVTVPADRFIWGYEDSLFTLAKTVMTFQKTLPDKFGILSHKNLKSNERITINTGRDDINAIGTVVKYNQDTSMAHWSTKECNRMDGTDGSFFGPDIIRAKKPVSIYHKDLCRKLPFEFQREHKILGIAPTYRYVPPVSVFADPDVEPKNQCFCHVDSGACPPHGIFNATPCALGPAYISFPHFLYGDPALRKPFIGLNPDEKKHSTYLDIHPRLGFTMAGLTKLQVNVLIKKANGINHLDIFEEDLMLPVAWFDVGLDPDNMPQYLIDVIYRTSFTIPRIEAALKFGCLLLLIITIAGIVLLVRGRIVNKTSRRTLERNISGLDCLIHM